MNDEIVGLIPAAGGGTRMFPFARAVPKEMYPILGKSVIEHCIENLREGGINKIYMVVGHQKGSLMDYVGDGSFFDVRVSYIYQMQRGGLGHAILQGDKWLNTTFVTLLGDSFIEPKSEINSLINLHKEKKPIATVLLFEVDDPTGYGVVKFKDLENSKGEIEKLFEKPNTESSREFEINGKYYALCGGYVFEPKIFEYINKTPPGVRDEVQITDAMQLALENGEKIYGLVLNGKYIDIGKWNTVLKVEREMIKNANIEDNIKEREELTKRVNSLND